MTPSGPREEVVIRSLLPLIILAFVLGTDFWVYADAKRQDERGAPPVVTLLTIEIGTPNAWLVGCLLLWIIFFPLYLVARGAE
ncbi:MAG: hypothetical protein JO248_06415 [Acidimicrobiia bacterium]|nr:hypothetical protein [Acidimicrobiia bacterium]